MDCFQRQYRFCKQYTKIDQSDLLAMLENI